MVGRGVNPPTRVNRRNQRPNSRERMAFNPLHTFQKNRRFWMAAILMICMVSFVFCTGMRGDMSDKIGNMFRGTSGPTVVTIDGRGVSDKDMDDLRMQRNLANSFMRICADLA